MKKKSLVLAALAAGTALTGVARAEGVVEKTLDVGPTWSVNQTASPKLYTRGGYQYVLYYDADRMLRLARRRLDSDKWREHVFPVQVGWQTGEHARIALAVDTDGNVHVAPYRRGLLQSPPPPDPIYYRTSRPHDLDSFERELMHGRNPGYPTFITGEDGTLYFAFRRGGSGSGSQYFNVYDPEERQWKQLPALLSGEGERSAYGSPRQGPDGRWHYFWVWREKAAAETTHTACYMVGENPRDWETAAGEPVDPPVTFANKKVVADPLKPGEGLLNSMINTGWDSRNRAVLSYHKYDEAGNSQIYNARFEDGEWRIVRATDWDFRWDFRGTGALGARIRVGNVEPGPDGRLYQRVYSDWRGDELLVLGEETLKPVKDAGMADEAPGDGVPDWRRPHIQPESDFDVRPMEVFWIRDKGESGEEGVSYWLRWEVGPRNSDRPVGKPWPEPTMLRVYKVRER